MYATRLIELLNYMTNIKFLLKIISIPHHTSLWEFQKLSLEVKSPGGVLPYMDHIVMYGPKGYVFLASEIGYPFDHFGRK